MTGHFTLAELTYSGTGLRRGLDNDPDGEQVANLWRLCTVLLEPIRALLGVPMHVNSGFRSTAVNAAVGGKATSAHLDGRACDFVPIGMSLAHATDLIHGSGLPFDQLILEYDAWIHVAVERTGSNPRGQVLKIGGAG